MPRLVSGSLSLLLCALAVRAESPELIRLNEAGIGHLHDGRPGDAVAAFEQALSGQPQSRLLKRNLAAALAALAEKRRDTREALEAIDLLNRATQLHPERLRYRVLLGRVRVEGGRDADRQLAREDFKFVLERAPDHLDGLVNLGQLDYMERRLDEAVKHWQHALRLKPSDSDIQARLAKAERERQVEASYERLESSTFLVRHAPSIGQEKAATVLQVCEEAYGDLSKRFESYPGQIVVTLYTLKEFRSATLMHGWVSGLSDGTIRLTVRRESTIDTIRPTIYHELTHHFVRGLAPRAPVWLHEGLAQIAEKKSVPQAEARLRRLKGLKASELSIRIVRQADPLQASRFYDVSLAFTNYLLELQGYSGFLRLLVQLRDEGASEDQALLRVYGADRDELYSRWRTRMQAR